MSSASQPAAAANSVVQQLELLERRFEATLRDLRKVRAELQRDASSRGVLGSRGLTQFLLEQLEAAAAEHARIAASNQRLASADFSTRRALPPPGLTISELMLSAERVGYEVPTRKTLAKRLTERSYRTGEIKFDEASGLWQWHGSQEAADGSR